MQSMTITEGEFKGWSTWPNEPFEHDAAGPFYLKQDTDGKMIAAFRAERKHMNAGGVVHGGALMTLADMALWDICRREIGFFNGVTVTMNAEFLAPGPIGAFIEATGEVMKLGRKMMFARGLVSANGETLLSFSGSLKRIPYLLAF